jgi:PAS domain S-box-containing protein
MNLLLLLPIFACITCCTLSLVILGRGVRHRASRLGAALTLAAAFWALCEILWSTAHDPQVVLGLVRLAAFGWISIGPITLHLFVELAGHPVRRRRGLLLALYGPTAVLLLIAVATPWLDVAAVKTHWGWGYQVGPAFPAAYVFAAGTFFAGLVIGIRDFRHSIAPGERRQAYVLLAGMLICLAIASVTDGVLPALGHHVPRLGVLAITLFAGTVAWGFQHYGYSLLAPGLFASEILATLPDGVALLRLNRRIRFANPGMEKLAGAGPGELEARPMEALIAEIRIDPEQEITERECVLLSASGESLPVAVSTSLLRDKRQNPIGLVLVARDLREVASLRSRLVVSDRLAAVGQLAAGIAHEINNPVAFVRANLGALAELLEAVGSKLPAQLEEELGASLGEGRELIDESLDGVDRVAAIVRDVKGFSHAGEVGPQRVELNPLLDSVLRVSAPQLPAGCCVERDYGEVPPVRGAPQELKQVFLNLVINAGQAIRGGEGIRITTRREAERVVVLLRDEGCGIPPERIERVFDPFFTTKPVGEGTGLGLSISYQIVHSHGGHISVESEPGCGTCFRVELPSADGHG